MGGTGCYRREFFLAGRLRKLSDPLLPAMEYSLAWVAFSQRTFMMRGDLLISTLMVGYPSFCLCSLPILLPFGWLAVLFRIWG